jgi:ATP-dependent protease HslVU (ClpYQ) peptidase subunit
MRAAQIVRHHVSPPEPPAKGESADAAAIRYVQSIKVALTEHGALENSKDGAHKQDATFLIGRKDALFFVDCGFCLNAASPQEPFLAIGSGDRPARGVLAYLHEYEPDMPAKKMVRRALEIAARQATGVAPPFDYISL